MAKIELTSYAFNGGELDPAMQARVDYQKYATGAAKMLNMIPRPTGGAWRRPGLRFIAAALHSDKPTWLIPFRFSVVQSYMLEFGDQKMRIIKDDGLVVYPAGHASAGQVVQITSPYNAEDLEQLSYVQTADLMFLVHPKYPIQKLMRYDHHDWRFQPLALGTELVPRPTGLAITLDGKNGKSYVVSAVNSKGEESYSSNKVTCVKAPGYHLDMPDTNTMSATECRNFLTANSQPIPSAWNVWAMNFDQLVNLLWGLEYYGASPYDPGGKGITLYYYRPDGSRFSPGEGKAMSQGMLLNEAIYTFTMPWGADLIAKARKSVVDYVNKFNAENSVTGKSRLKWNAVTGATSYRVYREEAFANESSRFCLIKETTDTTLYDNLLAYDPDKGLLASSVDFASPGDYPGAITIYEQRLVVGRTDNAPNTFWGSRTGAYENFTVHTPLQDDDSFHFPLDSRQVNEIAWLMPMNSLLIGTAGGEFRAGGSGYPIGPKAPDVHTQSNYGCAITQPLVVGRSVVFVGRSRRVLYDFQYSLEDDGFSGDSLTTLVEHLFENRHVVDKCYQQEPESVIWAVMSDGALLSCTYLPKQNVNAWAKHETDGKFKGCGSLINIDGTDRVYFNVERVINGVATRCIEVMDAPMVPVTDIKEAFYVDCGLTYRGTPTKRISGLSHLDNMTVQVLADGVFIDGVTVTDGAFELPEAAGVIHVGLGYRSELVTLDLEPIMQGGGTIRHRPRGIGKVTPTLMKSGNAEMAIVAKYQTLEPEWCPVFPQSTSENPAEPKLFTGEVAVIPYAARENNTTRVAIRCASPTPLAVLGLVAIADVGDV